MRIVVVHNQYGAFSGEEAVVETQAGLLRDRGHQVFSFLRSSREIETMVLGRARAFFSGIYSVAAECAMRRYLGEIGPDIVHVHNLYPLISPSVLRACRRMGIPVVMTVHNYRLICPIGLFLRKGAVCTRCAKGHEFWCALRNCTGDFAKSVGYAARNVVARKGKLYQRNVTRYLALTDFQRQRLVQEGFPAERIEVIPNMVDSTATPPSATLGSYVGYVGRISPEKGISTLMRAARLCADLRFRAAGSCSGAPDLVGQRPDNFDFLGHQPQRQLASFYADSRIIVLCSVAYEGFPMILPEAMAMGKPVVCSRIGGLPEIVEDGVTGLLFRPGDAGDLAGKIRHLWDRPDLCRRMGEAGREKVLREYSLQRHYARLMAAYATALGWAARGNRPRSHAETVPEVCEAQGC